MTSVGERTHTVGPVPWARAFLWSTALVVVGVLAWAWSVLPERVVLHVGPDNQADRWGSRWELVILGLVVVVLVTVLAPAFIRLLTRSAPSLLNYPHKEYWLAPERREAFLRRMADELAIFLGLTNLLMAAELFEITRLTLDPSRTFLGWVPLVVYLALMTVWMVWMVRRSKVGRDAS